MNNHQQKQCVRAIALMEAAKVLEDQICSLTKEAERAQRQFEHDRKRRDMPQAIKRYVELMQLGYTHRHAVRRACHEFALVDYWLEAHIMENHRSMKIYQRWERDRCIINKARIHSNGELAKMFKLSPGRISQIISKAFNRTLRRGDTPTLLLPPERMLPHVRANHKKKKGGQ